MMNSSLIKHYQETMLKLLPPNTFTTPNVKCGEIYCQSSTEFTILCALCKIKIFDFNDFLLHFKNSHFENDLIRTEVVEINATPGPTVKLEQPHFTDLDDANKDVYESQDPFHDETYEDFMTIPESDAEYEEDQDDIDSDKVYKMQVKTKKEKSRQLERTHQCDECGKSYIGAPQLKVHLKKEHESKESSESIKSMPCEQCEQKFSDQRRLDVHLIHIHGGIPCDKCPKKFKYRFELNRHYPVHTGVKSFACDYENCNKKFLTKRHLTNHKVIHRPEKAYVCDHCGYSCHKSATLRVHLRCHTGEKPFPCPICQKCFRSSSLLKEHKSTHSQERPHVCEVCGASFAHKKTLYHHKPLHLGIKKFVCKICGNAFAQAAGLAGHMRKHKEGLL